MSKAKVLFRQLGASNHTDKERELNDFYATDPRAVELLLKKEKFAHDIWEPACGKGHICRVLNMRGYNVRATDLIDRGYGLGGVDFLAQKEPWQGDIITNPPYKYAGDFAWHALELIPEGNKVALFLRVQFLEGKERRKMFEQQPPEFVYVSSGRMGCARNGEFNKTDASGAMCFAWFVWRKGFKGDPRVKWIN
ncbi:MAG: NAD(P)-dependent oxidoreductase [Clostridia bacterium]|nr:NAD(P)-dependent oxidoreductase [Clostridia bacterium]